MTQLGEHGRHCEHAMTGVTERERWNAKFLAGEAQMTQPNRLVMEACADLMPGRALDLAGGAGRHALWLAEHGWRVVLTDIADEGLALARRRAKEAGVAVVEADDGTVEMAGSIRLRREAGAETLAWAGGAERFDLVLVIRVLLREQFADLPKLLRRGGTLVYTTYTSEHARFAGGKSTRYALRPGELRDAFPGLKTMLYREEGGEAGLVARAE
jgi:tellurite methyltransferase